MSMNTSATVTIKPHPREVVREFLEACKNYGSAKFYNDVIAEIEDQVPYIRGNNHRATKYTPVYTKLLSR